MASTLPHKILSYIGTFLKEKDRLACALVCKHWTEPFLDAYWGILWIDNGRIDISTLDSNKSLLINAHRVWAAKTYEIYSNDYERILEFQRSFPGIRCVEFEDYGTSVLSLSHALDWSLWQSLKSIDIEVHCKRGTIHLDSLFLKLSVLPCLVHLAFFNSKDHPPLSWNDFESLHYHLPRLEYLEHDILFKPITRDEIESIKAVEPAQTMTRIEFNDDIDTHWFFYFALKYPNLRHFKLNEDFGSSNNNPIDYNPQQYQSDLQLLSTLDNFFPCLKRAATLLRNKNIYAWFIFFETLGHFGTKIEHADLRYSTGVKVDDVNRCIQPISESLKVLKIEFGDEVGVMPFDVGSRLVTLCIEGVYRCIIEVDAILEGFPALRLLSVTRIKFSLSTNTHTYTPHPLRRLKIEGSEINNAALHYLSLRCNQLKHVTLDNIDYNGTNERDYEDKDNDEAGQVIFDMSMTNLDTFVFAFSDGKRH
ncbi:hypothetical protein CLU79DRAFT_838296 [Phycomyces nitens]|nr:hypothetical protein CLU79DRAFT_838296 [Phycomyces nitens]